MSLISELMERGVLVDPELVPILKPLSSPLMADILQQISIKKFISKKNFLDNLEKISSILENTKDKKEDESLILIRKALSSLSNVKKESTNENKVKILKSWIIPSRKIVVDDFVKYFQNRFIELKAILQERSDVDNLTTLNKLSSQKQNATIIGLVSSKRVTKNKNVILELEDLTGRVSVLVSANKEELAKKVKSVVLDEVIAVKCTGNSEILFANEIIFPDAFQTKKKMEEEEYAVFISDIHLGSLKFLEENFMRFLQWVNGEAGNEQQKEISKKIRYLFIVGDNVDGVGIYPGQESLLKITDLKLQYKALSEIIGKIRKDISIFMIPGQHDASRIAEPQPPIDKEYAPDLYEIQNLFLLSNPAMVEIGATKNAAGLKVLMYHGANMHGLVDEIEELRIGKAMRTPTKIMKYLLAKRHLSPQHDSTDYIPIKDVDPFVIREIPDIVVTGDIHRSDVAMYNNIILIASSCWQSTTPFEEKIGHEPDPCKVPLLNLKTGQVNILDFS
jgi:DNA polymerase II small subunit